MNTLAIIALATVAATFDVASATTYSTEACTTTQTASAYTTLASLLTDDDMSTCTTDASYSMLYATSVPSTAQLTLMCASSACQRFVNAVLDLNPPDCVLTIPTSGLEMNILGYGSNFGEFCASLGASSASASTSGSGSIASSSTGASSSPGSNSSSPVASTSSSSSTASSASESLSSSGSGSTASSTSNSSSSFNATSSSSSAKPVCPDARL